MLKKLCIVMILSAVPLYSSNSKHAGSVARAEKAFGSQQRQSTKNDTNVVVPIIAQAIVVEDYNSTIQRLEAKTQKLETHCKNLDAKITQQLVEQKKIKEELVQVSRWSRGY